LKILPFRNLHFWDAYDIACAFCYTWKESELLAITNGTITKLIFFVPYIVNIIIHKKHKYTDSILNFSNLLCNIKSHRIFTYYTTAILLACIVSVLNLSWCSGGFLQLLSLMQ
jgi:hypothetical protein